MARKEYAHQLTQEAYDCLRRVASEQPDLWFDPDTNFESVLRSEGIRRYARRMDVEISSPIELTVDLSGGRRPNEADEQALDFYKSLSDLSPSQATDHLLWAWVAHFKLHEYCIDRWPLRGDKNPTSHILEHYFLGSMSMGLYQLNVASRTWWLAQTAIRAARASNGAYAAGQVVQYFARHAQHYHTIVMRSFLRNEVVLAEFVRLLLNEAEGISNDGLRELWHRLNLHAAAILIEALPRERLREILLEIADDVMSVPDFVADRTRLRDRSGIIQVLSLGAGVQSTVLALMADRGEYGLKKPDFAIFADTGWEPPAVYEHLDWLEQQLSYEVVRVSAGNIRDNILKGVAPDGHKFLGIPAYTINPDGTRGTLIRQCTDDYKLQPIYSYLRKHLDLKPGRRAPMDKGVAMWLGISVDEVARQKESQFEWVTFEHPLIDKDFSRAQLLSWFERNYPARTLPRSACIGCPYHSNAAWKDMKENDPESFADAVFVDSALRESPLTRGAVKGQAFLHAHRIPLKDIDLSDVTGYADLMMAECEGLCGI